MHLKNEGKNESSSTSRCFFYEGPKQQLAFKYFANDPIRSWRTVVAHCDSEKQYETDIPDIYIIGTNYPFKLLSLLTVRLLQITLPMCDWLWGILTRRIEFDGPLLKSIKFTYIFKS